MDLEEAKEGEPERLEFIIQWMKGKVNNQLYDMALLSLTGLAITLPPGIACMNPLMALSGLLKGPAYMVGKLIEGKTRTEIGEYLTGATLWASI